MQTKAEINLKSRKENLAHFKAFKLNSNKVKASADSLKHASSAEEKIQLIQKITFDLNRAIAALKRCDSLMKEKPKMLGFLENELKKYERMLKEETMLQKKPKALSTNTITTSLKAAHSPEAPRKDKPTTQTSKKPQKLVIPPFKKPGVTAPSATTNEQPKIRKSPSMPNLSLFASQTSLSPISIEFDKHLESLESKSKGPSEKKSQ